MRRTEYLSELATDARFACRQLVRNPGFTAVAVVTLALGIGATTAIFSAVQSVVLKPLPFPQPDRLLSVYEYVRDNRNNISAGNFLDVLEERRYRAAVDADWMKAREDGVTGVPTFVAGNRRVVGAQPYDALVELVR